MYFIAEIIDNITKSFLSALFLWVTVLLKIRAGYIKKAKNKINFDIDLGETAVARQRLGENFWAVTDTHAEMEELLEVAS